VFSYINIDYYEVLAHVEGTILLDGQDIVVNGIGKFDHNFNL
jgi:hypothetical protein